MKYFLIPEIITDASDSLGCAHCVYGVDREKGVSMNFRTKCAEPLSSPVSADDTVLLTVHISLNNLADSILIPSTKL